MCFSEEVDNNLTISELHMLIYNITKIIEKRQGPPQVDSVRAAALSLGVSAGTRTRDFWQLGIWWHIVAFQCVSRANPLVRTSRHQQLPLR